MGNRYDNEQRVVRPLDQPTGHNQITPAHVDRLLNSGTDPHTVYAAPVQSTIDNVFNPQPITKDHYSPIQRGLGMALRLALLAIVYCILAGGIVYQAALAEPWFYILFAVPMCLTTIYLGRQTDRHTPAGVELERIAAAERVELAKGERQERILSQHLTHKQELARMALSASIKMLGGDTNGTGK